MTRIALLVCALAAVAVALPREMDHHDIDTKWDEKKTDSLVDKRVNDHVLEKLEKLDDKLDKLEMVADRLFGMSSANAVAIANANSFGGMFGRRRRAVSPMAEAEFDEKVIDKLEKLDAKLDKLEVVAERLFGMSSANAVAIANANSFGGMFGG